jgi:TRAP-type C4-dicarboxylate transport system substrate-binding protein
MSIYQPVDLMDLTVSLRAWNRVSEKVQNIVEAEVRNYSQTHYLAIQKRNFEAMVKFKEAGSKVSRLSTADFDEFRRAAIPIWYKWAGKDAAAKEIFELQLEYMKNDLVGYITDKDIEGMSY